MKRMPLSLREIAAWTLTALTGAFVLSAGAAGAQVVTISDSEFAPSDWSLTLIDSNGNGGSSSPSQVTSGGNPGAYRLMDQTVQGAPNGSSFSSMMFFHAYQGDVCDPAAECGIASVSMFLDTIQFNPPFVGAAGQGVAAAIRQNGTVYLGGSFITPEQTWTPRSLLGLAANDFTAVGGTTHPDFTAAGAPIEVGFTTSNSTCHGCSGYTTQVGYDNFRFELTTSPDPESYCTAGISASGCQASIGSSGTPSASAPSGFSLIIGGVEGHKDGLFFFGTNGRQGNPWGNGTSYQCVVPPVKRTPLIAGVGTIGTCDGTFSYDLNAHWTAKPAHNPDAGNIVQAQLWYRDPGNTSNQPTSLSDALEFQVCQ